MIAATTLDLTKEAAAFVDTGVHWCAGRLTVSDLNRVLDTARVRCNAAGQRAAPGPG